MIANTSADTITAMSDMTTATIAILASASAHRFTTTTMTPGADMVTTGIMPCVSVIMIGTMKDNIGMTIADDAILIEVNGIEATIIQGGASASAKTGRWQVPVRCNFLPVALAILPVAGVDTSVLQSACQPNRQCHGLTLS